MTAIKIDTTKLQTIREYADERGITTSYIYRMIRLNKFKEKKVVTVLGTKYIQR